MKDNLKKEKEKKTLHLFFPGSVSFVGSVRSVPFITIPH
jgi:hypothetical protein